MSAILNSMLTGNAGGDTGPVSGATAHTDGAIEVIHTEAIQKKTNRGMRLSQTRRVRAAAWMAKYGRFDLRRKNVCR